MTNPIAFTGLNQGTALSSGTLALPPLVVEGLAEFKGSFDRLCLKAGISAIETMLAADGEALCGRRYGRNVVRRGYRWGRTRSEIDYHGGKAVIGRPRVRAKGAEVALASWQTIKDADLLSGWAFNQMLIGVTTRKYRRSVRLPEGDLAGTGLRATTRSSVSRRFVALSAAKLREWLSADLSGLDLLIIQIDGLRVGDHILVAAIGTDGAGDKHVLALIEGATENAAVVKALLADVVARGLDPGIARLFIVDGAKALSRAIRDTFGRCALIQRCQVHKGRNIIERLPPALHTGVKKSAAPGVGQPDGRAGGAVAEELGAAPRSRRTGGLGLHPRRARRDAHGHPSRSAARAASRARLHQCHREPDGGHPPSLPQRQTLAKHQDGVALDRHRDAGSQKDLPPPQGLQATAGAEGRTAAPSTGAPHRDDR